ncbi:hypothetical protein LTR08_000528 [Meristemomyces frigidus]|nr:hypothetical protein LTR08_000528 [Meristemomyces frigidus]
MAGSKDKKKPNSFAGTGQSLSGIKVKGKPTNADQSKKRQGDDSYVSDPEEETDSDKSSDGYEAKSTGKENFTSGMPNPTVVSLRSLPFCS